MNFNKYTIKAQEVIQKAAEIAKAAQQPIIETGHLTKAIFLQDENLTNFVFDKLNINRNYFNTRLEEINKGYPRSNAENPYLSNDAARAMQKAEKQMDSMKDEYVAIEHILLGILAGNDAVASLMKGAGFYEKLLKLAIEELRGGDRVQTKTQKQNINR